MKKKLIAMLLCIVMCLTCMPAPKAFAADNMASGEGWNLDSSGCLHITGAVHNEATIYEGKAPWEDYAEKIGKVVAEPGSSVDNCACLFLNCINLAEVDLHNLNTSGVEDMGMMFAACWSLQSLNIDGLDTSGVYDMSSMFWGCGLTKLDLRGFDTSNVRAMSYMFEYCENLESLDVSSFNTSNVISMYGMFARCQNLSSLGLSNFNVNDETDVTDMFAQCDSLEEVSVSPSLAKKVANQLLGLSSSWTNSRNGNVYSTSSALYGLYTNTTLVRNNYTITFDMADTGVQAPASQTVTKGSKATKPADPKYVGYNFDGWYIEPWCETKYNFDSPVTKSLTLYAGFSKPAPPEIIPDVIVSYRTHVQSIGWQDYVSNGKTAGTYGKAKRLEGIEIEVIGNNNLGIIYTTHCQTYGWLPWSSNGDMNGTEGEAKRLEAIEIKLTGADKDKYDVYYRVHAQSYGWLGWAKNGAPAGTAGYAKRLEGIQIIVKKKGEAAPTNTLQANEGIIYNDPNNGGIAKPYYARPGDSPVVNNNPTSSTAPIILGESLTTVAYRTHVQSFGWQGWKFNGQMSGTSGMAKRLEGINIKIVNKQYAGGITYRTHVQTYGWQDWKSDGKMAGTSGEAKRLEAIEIKLTGEMEKQYDVYYRVHAQSYGWLGWAKNGAPSGTAGYRKRLEGIQIVLVKKGDKAPGKTYMGITSQDSRAYIQK